MYRSLTSTVLGVWFLALVGCSEEAPPTTSAVAYPLRLIPTLTERQEDVIYSASFEKATPILDILQGRDSSDGASEGRPLDGWFAIDYAGEVARITVAAAHPAVEHKDGVLTVRNPGVAIIRFLVVPAGRGVTARASLDITDPDGSGILDADFQIPAVRNIPEGMSLAEVIQTNGAAGPKLLGYIQEGLATGNTAGAVQWNQEPGERFGEVRTFASRIPKRHLRMLAIVSRLGPVSVRDVQVELAPTSRPLLPADFASPEAASSVRGDATPVFATIGHERRDALRIPPGGLVQFTVPGLVDATELTYGVGLEPGAGREGNAVLRVSGEVGDERVLLDEGHLPIDRLWASRFHDRKVTVPEALRVGPSVELSFENVGEQPIVLAAPIVRGPAGQGRPNLLLVSIDTLRADRLGFGGYDRPTSPFLDTVAASSTVFKDYLAVAPYTLPTHVTMLTGLLPPRHGVFGLSSRVGGAGLGWLPSMLANQGYATAAFTAGGYVSPAFGFATGFDRYGISDPMLPLQGVGLTPPRPEVRRTMDDVADWIFARRNEPWFAFVHTYVTHNYYVDAETFRPFDSGEESAWRGRLDEVFPQSEFAPWRSSPPTPADINYLSDLYDATIRSVDDQLRRFVDRLQGSGSLQNTVVVITSDHGEEIWDHESLRHSISVYEEMLQVPLLIWRPDGLWSPREIRDPTTQADLMPTILDLLGLPALPDRDGTSRAGLVRGSGAPGQGTPLLAHVDTVMSRRFALREGSLKVVYGDPNPRYASPVEKEWTLFDLGSDPGEEHDLADDRPRDFARMRERLEDLMSELSRDALEGAGASIDPALQRQLEQLGYVR